MWFIVTVIHSDTLASLMQYHYKLCSPKGDLVGVGEGNKRKTEDEPEGGAATADGGAGTGVTTAAAPAKKPKMSAADIKSLPTRQYLDQVCTPTTGVVGRLIR